MKPLTFEILTRLMVAAAIAIVVVPLFVRRGSQTIWLSASAAALFIYLGSALAYPYLSNWHWPGPGMARTAARAPAPTPPPGAADIGALQAAAHAAPEDPDAWARLAMALLRSERTGEAAGSLQKVYELTGGSNVDMSMLLVDALMASGDDKRGQVNQLVEDILMRSPEHPKALYYGAELAFSRREYEVARLRWGRLLARARTENTDEARQVIAVLERRIASLDGAPAAADPGTGAGPSVVVEIGLDPALAGRVDANAPLFILARAPGEAGPPVAVVRRQASELPVTVTLSDADAMLPTRKLSQFETVEVVARIALSGTPTAKPGDLYGSATVAGAKGGAVSIQIANVAQ